MGRAALDEWETWKTKAASSLRGEGWWRGGGPLRWNPREFLNLSHRFSVFAINKYGLWQFHFRRCAKPPLLKTTFFQVGRSSGETLAGFKNCDLVVAKAGKLTVGLHLGSFCSFFEPHWGTAALKLSSLRRSRGFDFTFNPSFLLHTSSNRPSLHTDICIGKHRYHCLVSVLY